MNSFLLSRRFFNHVVIRNVQFRSFSSLFVNNTLLVLLDVLRSLRFILSIRSLLLVWIDEPDDFFVLKLVEPDFLFLFFKDKLFPFQLSFKFFPLSLKGSDFLVTLFLDLGSLSFQFFNLFFELSNCVLVDFLLLRIAFLFFFFELGFNLLDFGLLHNVCLMKFSDLFLFLVDGFDLLFGLLSQLFQLFFHPLDFLNCLFVFIVLDGFVLGLPDFLQWFFLFFQSA